MRHSGACEFLSLLEWSLGMLSKHVGHQILKYGRLGELMFESALASRRLHTRHPLVGDALCEATAIAVHRSQFAEICDDLEH